MINLADAYVPIIKLNFYGVQIDLLIARIQM
jgi:poly(A) polymerase Pap1